MNRNSLRPTYAALTGEERFRLIVQTGAAGDDKEAMYLLRSCPKVEVAAVDPSFTTPAMNSHRLVSAFARAAGPYLGWLDAVEMLEHLLTGERAPRLLPQDAQFPVATVLDRAAEAAARDLRALRDAFEGVCRTRVGLPPEALLGFWAPEVAAALDAAEEWTQELEPDPVSRERFRAALDLAWILSPEPEGG